MGVFGRQEEGDTDAVHGEYCKTEDLRDLNTYNERWTALQLVVTDVIGWMDRGASDVSLHAHISLQYTLSHTHAHHREHRDKNKGLGSINPNFKSSAFRPPWITHPNLPALTPLFPHLCLLPSASTPPSLPLSLHHPVHLTVSLLISFYLCLPPSLFHNSLSRHNSLYSINSFPPYFIGPSLHRLLFINHPIYLPLPVKVSAF